MSPVKLETQNSTLTNIPISNAWYGSPGHIIKDRGTISIVTHKLNSEILLTNRETKNV